MLLLREFVEDVLTDETSVEVETRLTIGRGSTVDIKIGQNFHPVIQRSISRIQATIERNDDDDIVIRDGDEVPSSSGVYFRGKRICDFLVIDPDQPIVLFEWHKTIEKFPGWNSVRLEIVMFSAKSQKDPVTGSNDWQKISTQVETLTETVDFLVQSLAEHREMLAGVEERVEKQLDTIVNPQLAEIRDRLSVQQGHDRRHSGDIARILSQIRLVGVAIAFVLGSSILLSGIRGAKDDSQYSWLDAVRAGIPIVAAAIVAGKLSNKKT